MTPLDLVCCAALALLPETPEEEARGLLARAETHAREERFSEALAIYKKLAREFPETPEGKIGSRRSMPSAFVGWSDVVRHGPSSNRVDVVLMGEGYTLDHQKAFDNLAEDIPRLFERQKTFREYWSYFNFLRANLVSADSGVDGFGREYDTALNAQTLKTFSGHVGVDRAKVREMLAEMPEHDSQAIVFVKQGVLGTGGGGVAVIGGMSARTTVHEFGHSFGGLSDEYAEQQAHNQGAVRDGINVAATDDPKLVPWAHWIAAKHPGIGVYEGAAARVRGAWKPTASGCVMENGEFFCPVCQEALVLRIYSIVDPIESASPPPPPPEIREPIVLRDEPIEIRVTVMKPASHDLQLDWWVLPESRVPETGDGRDRGAPGRGRTGVAPAPSRSAPAGRFGDRRDRGKLAPIPDRTWSTNRVDADGVHTLRLRRSDLEPGRYKVVCRAKDSTRLRDEKWPWVVKDEHGVLESERVWWVRVP
ncbi:MAG: M64 family metallopeptidase [Planctomycetota bacterium]